MTQQFLKSDQTSRSNFILPFKFLLIFMALLLDCALADSPNETDVTLDGSVVVIDVGRYAFVSVEQGIYLKESLKKIRESQVSAVVLKVDCPGGLASEARWFIEDLAELRVPTISFIFGDAAGAGALAAISAERIYFGNGNSLGGEPENIEWRGPSNSIPSRLTDLRYYDITKDLIEALEKVGRDKQLIEGLCDPDKEVVIKGSKLARIGEILSIDASASLEKLGINGGKADNITSALAHAGIKGEPVFLRPPNVIIERSMLENSNAKEEVSKELADADEDETSLVNQKNKQPDSRRAFGETRLESYAEKIVVIPVGMESLMRKTKFEFMQRIIKKADEDGASAIIFDLNTPGGVAWYTEEIMLSDLQHLSVPTYSFVNPKAMSAGALIAIATDYIYMHQPSTIGAAAPVMGTGQDIPETMLKKVMGDILATADNVARIKGHNPQIAKAFIDSKIEISFKIPVIKGDGSLDYRDAFNPDTEKDLLVLNAWQATQIIDGQKIFAEGIATSLEDLVQKAELKGDIIIAQPLGFELVGDWIVKLAPWLLLFGIAGAYMELKAPGFGVPGFIALACFGLFFFGHSAAGYLAGFEVVGIFLLGVLLLIIEVFVFPGLIVFGFIGAICVLGSLIYAMVDPLDLNWDGSINFSAIGNLLGEPMMNLTIALVGASVLGLLLMRYLASFPMTRWMVLDAEVKRGTALKNSIGSGNEQSLVGEIGIAMTDLRPSGAAMIGEERIDVVSNGDFIESESEVVVIEQEGSRIVVERV